jgi:hypothetical protein
MRTFNVGNRRDDELFGVDLRIVGCEQTGCQRPAECAHLGLPGGPRGGRHRDARQQPRPV